MIVPILPLKKINSEVTPPTIPQETHRDTFKDFYQSLLQFNFKNLKLNRDNYKSKLPLLFNDVLNISNNLLEMQRKGSSPTQGLFNILLDAPAIEKAKPYFQSLFTGKIPQLSDYHKYVEMQTKNNISLTRKDYFEPLTKLITKFTGNMDKALFSLARGTSDLNKAIKGVFSNKTSNENFYGIIPLGYTNTINYGKLRWERLDWMQIDPIAAANGVVLYNGTTRPDMNLHKLNLNKKNQIEPLIPVLPVKNLKEPDINKINPFLKGSSEKYAEAHFNNSKFNKTVKAMLNSGADFINNMFDVFIVYRDKEDVLKTLDENLGNSFISKGVKFERILNGTSSFNSIFMIRTSSISVPQMKNETFDLKWVNHTVKKIKSKVSYIRKSELKILMDEPMYMNLLFNLFSGTSRSSSFVGTDSNIKLHNTYGGNLASFDIIVKHESLLNYPYLESMKENWRHENKNILHAGLRPQEMPLWWFRDVKFLGESSNFTFNRESPSIMEGTFPFTFSRCVKIDRSAKTLVQNVLFNNTDSMENTESAWLKEQTMGQGNQEWMWDTDFWKNWGKGVSTDSLSYSEDAPKYDGIPQNMGIPQFIG